jgi:hypothetical protein
MLFLIKAFLVLSLNGRASIGIVLTDELSSAGAEASSDKSS